MGRGRTTTGGPTRILRCTRTEGVSETWTVRDPDTPDESRKSRRDLKVDTVLRRGGGRVVGRTTKDRS